MTLTERDTNQNVSNSNSGKRKKVEIDLTNDDSDTDDEQPPFKAAKNGAQRSNASSQQFRYPSALPTPPLSSAPRSSQPQSTGHSTGRYDSFHSSTSSQTLADNQHTQAERESWLVDDDEDYSETIASTQTAAGDTEQLTLYGTLSTKIVGVQYYRGNANPGEQILMRREPGNPYDKNAIRIDNVAATQIGHIPRKVAEKLAKFMDSGRLHTEGELAGYIGQFDCPLSVHMYGPDPQSDEGQRLISDMKGDKLPVKAVEQAEKQREKERKEEEKRKQQEEKRRLAEARKAAAAGGTGNGRVPVQANQYGYANQSQAGLNSTPVMSDILEASQRFNPREIGRATDEYGMKEDKLKSMPMAEKPAGIRTTMLPYQLQALQWMLNQESPQLPPKGTKDAAVQLWKRNDRNPNLFTNLATTFSTESPELASGGILADDMGLGKTLEVISLIIADKDKAHNNPGPTLLVAPLSVMSNWTTQISQHVKKSHELSIYVYHGSGRVQMKKADFEEYDVIITTYGTLSSDYAPKGKNSSSNKQADRQLRSTGLFSVHWRRIVLDEGHQIRNPASKMASAATALTAQSRWVLTGTPIVNTLKDLYCLLRFLGVSGGLETLEIFNRVLVRPLKQGEASATFLLQAVMAAFTLRRRKGMAFIDLRLPKLDEYVHRVEFTTKERERYDALTAEAQGLLKRYENKAGQQGKGAGEAFQNLLEILLRMRQCCNHWQMCGERITNLLAKLEEQKTVDLTPENEKALQDMLQIHLESQEDCPVCMETLYDHDPVVTTCGHSFCRLCITTAIEGQKKCPMCRARLEDAESTLVGPAQESTDKQADEDDEMDLTQSSTKLESMMEILAASKTNKDKTVIFSQWTKFLDIVESRLDREGYKFCRIDGTMNAQKRDAALQALDEDPECTIMLASLSVCAVGLNLTAANQVILSDTWWSPAIEDQAVDRVHRLGQRPETRVFRLIMENSIEEHTIKIQEEKRKLMQLAFSEKDGKRQNAKTGRLADIQRLLRGSGNGGE